jgi:4-diphosphocytidyl-2-C-methyl-D-erythritol kinase
MVRLRAFAKINYALEVRGLRGDGYHEIRTVMQSVSLADEVEIEHAEEGFELQTEPGCSDVGPPEENTVRKAWKLMCGLVGAELPVRIRLHKRIPSRAGLGGGSADAAAALYGINELLGLGLNHEELSDVGGWIGADVPFCLLGGTALGGGVGDLLTPLPAPPAHRGEGWPPSKPSSRGCARATSPRSPVPSATTSSLSPGNSCRRWRRTGRSS